MSESQQLGSESAVAEYRRRLEARRETAERQQRRYRKLTRVRGVILGVFIILAVLAEKETLRNKIAVLALPAVLLAVVDRRRAWALRMYHRLARAAAFYERRLACVEDRWAGGGEPGTRYLHEAHPCAADLDLFGTGCLFELLCTARTRPGEDTLAAWLLTPASAEVVRERQAAVAELRARLDLREELDLLRSDRSGTVEVATLAEWARQTPTRVAPVAALTGPVLVGLLVAAVAGGALFGAGLAPVVAAWLLGGLFALGLRGLVRQVVYPIKDHGADLAFLAELLAHLEREPLTSPLLGALQASLTVHGRPASRHLTRLGWLVRYWPLASLLFWMPQLALVVGAWQRRLGPALGRWLDAVGEFEALSALAAYAYENPDDPFPELVSEGPCFDAQELGHPLLPRARCVRNDVCLAGELRLLVVSGSNMSGKSTLLRSLGVNAVLGLAGAPVRASRLRLSPLAVGATLRLQDSLQAGRSRFYAEITRLRQLVDLAKGPRPLLFLLDELLSGTNSHDRRVGAEAVLRRLVAAGAIGLVTTHDLALTDIADLLAPRAANVHFEDYLQDGTLTFDYRMRPGVVRNSNALALMRSVGIEV